MAGLGKYGDEGFSAYHSKKNPFLIAQAVSSSPVSMKNSPMKDFGLISGPIAAALAAAAKAAAATKVGAAVVGAAKAVGAKLAATKVGGAVVKGVSAVSKGVKAAKGAIKASKIGKAVGKVSKGIKKFTGKITPKIGGKAGETAATEATKTGVEQATKSVTKTGIEGATKAGTEGAIKTSSKGGFDATKVGTSKPIAGETDILTKNIKSKGGFNPNATKVNTSKPVTGETDILTRNIKDTSDLSKTPSVAGEGAKDATTTKEPSWLDQQLSTENLLSKGKSSLDSADAKSEAEGEKARARSAQHFANAGQDFGGQQSHVPQEDLGSVLTFKRAMPKPIPLRLRAKRALSPFKNKGKMKMDEAKGWGSEKMSGMKEGAGELGKSKSKVKDSLNSMSVFGDK